MAIIKDATKMSALYYNAEKIGNGYVGIKLVYGPASPFFSFILSLDMDGDYDFYATIRRDKLGNMYVGEYVKLNISAKKGDEVIVKSIPEITELYPEYRVYLNTSLQSITFYKSHIGFSYGGTVTDKVHVTQTPRSAHSLCMSCKAPRIVIDSTKSTTNMSYMFHNCINLTNLDVSNFDTSLVTTMSYMFYGCSRLTNLDVSNFDTSLVTTMYGMFSACPSLTNVIFGPNWGSQKTYSSRMRLKLDNLSLDLTDETWASLLTIYDRQAAGYSTYTISLSEDHTPPSGWIDKMTVRGYTINMV